MKTKVLVDGTPPRTLATGGWGYSNFDQDLKPLTDEKTMYACFVCHQAVTARDYIFTKYAP